MAAVEDPNVPKGAQEMLKQAEAGLKLLAGKDESTVTDKPAAEAFKAEHEAKIAEMQRVIESLSGKDNKKERTAKSKELADFKVHKQYIDACKVVKGFDPVNGFFTIKLAGGDKVEVQAAESASAQQAGKADADAKKKPRPAKQAESAGLSPAEKRELEQLKNDIITRKAQLKEQGMSGGQQNKDAQVVGWVNRMNELKEKESPGSTAKGDKKEEKKSKKVLNSDMQKAVDSLRQEIEEYKGRLRTEFGYTNKDIKADPELSEMEAKLAAIEK
jgi:hypothetical protein